MIAKRYSYRTASTRAAELRDHGTGQRMHSPCSTASRLHRGATMSQCPFSFSRGPAEHKKCGSCCSMFTLPTPAPAVTLLCTSCMPPVRARVFCGPPSVQHHRQPCSGASRARTTIRRYCCKVTSTCSRPRPPRPYREKFHILSTRRPRVRQATDPPATQKT